uniref:Putative secreted peptide n=1 Tax=Anopheles braziliensis TaxID=58242 RepID=A0A2M3ZNN2_9DIPT
MMWPQEQLLLWLPLMMLLLMMIPTLSSSSYCQYFRLSLPAICSAVLPSPVWRVAEDLVPELPKLSRLCSSVVSV